MIRGHFASVFVNRALQSFVLAARYYSWVEQKQQQSEYNFFVQRSKRLKNLTSITQNGLTGAVAGARKAVKNARDRTKSRKKKKQQRDQELTDLESMLPSGRSVQPDDVNIELEV